MREGVRPVHYLYLSLSLLCQATAVVLGKTAALRLGHPTVGAFLSSPWYVGGLFCLALQAFFWQLVLRRVHLFAAYLVTSLNAFLVLAASRVFFLERVTNLNLIGAAVIVSGVYLVIREAPE
jgi:drug/metabolite transporter (DMT)-like permease